VLVKHISRENQRTREEFERTRLDSSSGKVVRTRDVDDAKWQITRSYRAFVPGRVHHNPIGIRTAVS
jgi:hypothetical protein